MLFDVDVSKSEIWIGGRGLEVTEGGSKVMSIVSDRVLVCTEKRATGLVGSIWRLKLAGGLIEGTIEGHVTRIKVDRTGDRLELHGHIGPYDLAVVLNDDQLAVEFFGMKAVFVRDRGAGKGQEAVYVRQDRGYRLSLDRGAVRRAGTSPEFLYTLLALEIFTHDHRTREKMRPGWEGAPPDYQAGGSSETADPRRPLPRLPPRCPTRRTPHQGICPVAPQNPSAHKIR